ncbi:rab11 family-interacting protein 1 isoform X2 [Brienomyrus brachyistius]|uniref:rab11 family-interacting protein 1 isoform X2 n=1 Tax=Brienomyrus brachyistius TaxID=42636 RepID=UPI0020B38D5E|nr:rab11 family-interacting protein 1 isoform X2 [Brienomyrus brachyistius]
MSLAEQSQQWCPTSVKVTVLQARGLKIKGKNGTNDAYAIMQVAKDKFSTAVAEKSVTPMWKEEATFDLPLFQQGSADRSTLYVQVMHRALMGMDKMLGQAIIDLVQLQANKSRNKTDWFKLLNKSGKQDKERGEVQLDIQFLRSNMTASMYDLSAQDKPRSRMGKLKDKLRGKHRGGHSDSISAIVPSVSQGLTDSEGEEGNEDDDKTGTQKSSMSLLTPKTNLQRNISQSMSHLGSGSEWDTTSKDHQDPSDGKKIFGFLTHKRSGSSDSKVSHGPLSLLGQHKQAPAEPVTICINGSHVYNEEPQAKPSHTGSALSLSGSPRGSTENLHRVGKGDGTGSSADTFKGFEKMKPEKVEQERKKQEEQERERTRQEEQEMERKKLEERERKRQEEQEREKKRQEELEKKKVEERERERKRQEEQERERKRLEEQERERKRQEELEKKKVEERERERKRQEEQERERKRLEEQEREKKRQEELEKERKRQEELEKKKVEERERERKRQEEQERERKRLEEQEREKKRQEELEKERKRQEELEKKKVEERERERKRQEEQERERMGLEEQEKERKRQEELEKERKRQEELGKRNQEKISQEVNTKVEQRPGKETPEVYSSNPFDDTNSSSPFEESPLEELHGISGRPSRLTRVSAVKPRRHPVKPLRTAEIQSVTSAAVAPVGHDVGVQAAISEKSKEPEAKEEGPYSQLTRSELIALLVKQQAQLAEQSKKIRNLEDYIDNLLVRVMEENPSILMDLSGTKKAI